MSDHLTENLKNKAIACMEECAIALQKTSKTKRSLVWKSERSPYIKPQKQSDRLLWKSERSLCRKPQK
ncbi:MAG: hypothetical protein V7L05_05280 [Nostoc sp.]|uniref:hypothetical protein n=1 Tax=Nostoc sp. TaxID=1180 RepID=UPI002FF7C603